MKFRKVIAGIVTAAMAMSCFGFSALPSNASTNENTVQLGDVHGNDGVTASDATYIGYYLNGTYPATAKQVAAMDVNQDGLIDSRDATTLLSMIASGATFDTVSYNNNKPYDMQMTYRRHYCSSVDTLSFYTYTLFPNSSSLSEMELFTENMIDSNETDSVIPNTVNSVNTEDYENTSCVELIITNADNSISHASGFVVGENIVATSAKALYKNGFAKNVTVNIYNSTCSYVMDSADAVTIHIPDNYVNSSGNLNNNYDYGLVYLGNDVDWSDYAVEFGIMTNKFLKLDGNTGNYELTTSGFEYSNLEDKWIRYFSYGNVQPITDTSQNYFRFHSLGKYKEGGMVYSGFLTSEKRAVGISTHTSSIGNYAGTDTYGIRITPTLLRFYLQNNNLS